METQIFKTWNEFYNRENKELNGVSEDFAKNNPEYQKENETNKGCWNCSDCSRCSGCSGCSRCSGCSGCSDCSRCSGCSDWKNNTPPINLLKDIPKIENIHQKVLDAVSKKGALYMSDWHKDNSVDENGAYCGTTHCRAGWIVALAGKAGRDLELATTPIFAAMMIVKESSDIKISPPRYFESNDVALADIKRCAELEKSK